MARRSVVVERVYDHPGDEEAFRVFVDRLWPRGLRKDAFHHDDWAKDLAPSTGLRKWYSHDASQFAEFRDRYLAELDGPDARAALARLDDLADGRSVVLLTATRDLEHSGAAVLAERMRGAR
ncbi:MULTISPECIES: DUF488 domain-containing protein [Rhodococcus]|jgi:uncharacterized protein YeaO (DUF488 family)|uniref:DUF488 family protein n=1 Tax=Rhodococcus aetherivorans TaxID=191292 RepID=A0A059MS75_9NOCA|nr:MULTISPECIES: DUF488 family protein [Rhodococcus]ETT28499.1 protein of unknown function DUF488 [Rhodococcus rhodochrous ATCC 21198]NCL78099.1 hypothetical protein [Rhodococcus sp. YH1]AKE89498.1 hypothetical protein AAT18_09940 [Rhodococcus aetherivorans]KDE14054.1 hypothetical protein N505_0107030 [Rhodococcus aetherivorans]MBC2590666.1 DUF488 family protein [Rhodococcus aetherivorans]